MSLRDSDYVNEVYARLSLPFTAVEGELAAPHFCHLLMEIITRLERLEVTLNESA